MTDIIQATHSKDRARLDSLIINEIHNIENFIIEAVANNKFETTVYDTLMTRTNNDFLPTRTAKAHCIMRVNDLTLNNNPLNYTLWATGVMYAVGIKVFYDGEYYICTEEHISGDVFDVSKWKVDETVRYGDYKVGEELTISGLTSNNPCSFRITEVTEKGRIVNMEVVSRGEYTDIAVSGNLEYTDKTNYLDIYNDFGLQGDIRINRNGQEYVKVNTEWTDLSGVIYNQDSIPASTFGTVDSIYYVTDYDNILVKINETNWVQHNNYYFYNTFVLPQDFGTEFATAYGVFGNDYIKLAKDQPNLSWYRVKNILRLNYMPSSDIGMENDILYYTYRTVDNDLQTDKFVKINGFWHPIPNPVEYDFSNKPDNSFGENLDLFQYNPNIVFVKNNNEWIQAINQYRYDMIHTYADWGENLDMIRYSGTYAPQQWYTKIDGTWVEVEKVWDLNNYKIGVDANAEKITWGIKEIIVDDTGDGYQWQVDVLFSSGDAIAKAIVSNAKIIEIETLYGGTALEEIPVISFKMNGTNISYDCYSVWKRTKENDVLDDAMNQVIDYFTAKNYSITRVTNDQTETTFNWLIRWR